MKDKSGNFFNSFNNFISQNPHYGYLIAAAGFAIFFLGFLFRWNWIINPEGDTRSVYIYEVVGKETMRKIMIVVTALVALICIGVFFLSDSKQKNNSKNTLNTKVTKQQ
jgi:hypothetical protein